MAELVAKAGPQIEALQKYFESQIELVESGPAGQAEAQRRIGQGKDDFDAFRATHAEIEADTQKFVNDALFLYVTHDVAPRAMTSKVKGFVQAQNWYQNFSSITVE